MLMDPENMPMRVEFVGYTGKWPSLCCGILTLRIDGEEITFGDSSKAQHPKFWSSGGSSPMPPDDISHGPWQVSVKDLPEAYRPYAMEIDAVMNANIEPGCCGGCR